MLYQPKRLKIEQNSTFLSFHTIIKYDHILIDNKFLNNSCVTIIDQMQ